MEGLFDTIFNGLGGAFVAVVGTVVIGWLGYRSGKVQFSFLKRKSEDGELQNRTRWETKVDGDIEELKGDNAEIKEELKRINSDKKVCGAHETDIELLKEKVLAMQAVNGNQDAADESIKAQVYEHGRDIDLMKYQIGEFKEVVGKLTEKIDSNQTALYKKIDENQKDLIALINTRGKNGERSS